MKHELDVRPYRHPSGGWGSVRSLANILRRGGVPLSCQPTSNAETRGDVSSVPIRLPHTAATCSARASAIT